MSTSANWAALADRCEKATGPDREIDEAIIIACGGYQPLPEHYPSLWHDRDGEPSVHKPFTASLDAITALIERELPAAWAWTLGQNIHHRTWCVSINNLDDDGAPYSMFWAASQCSPALALCAAFCRAMAEKAKP